MSTYQIPNINNKPPQLVDSSFYGDIRYDPDDSAPEYIGMNVTNGASTAASDWKIVKYTFSGSTTNATRMQTAYGSWDGRASLFP